MVTLFLLSLVLALIALFTVLGDIFFATKKEREGRQERKVNGHDTLIIALYALLRIAKRKLSNVRRLVLAYILHLSVRVLRIFDRASFFLYAKSRNLFIKNAVKHKGTVPFFWEYLKTYKQEADRERELKSREEE
jgi:hypothetical protein